MVTRLGRVEGLFGRRLDELDYRTIAELVGSPEAAEGEDLDYKQEHYRQDDRGREELAKDITAFANHIGRLLVIGMAENKGVPSKVLDVDLDDARLRHIRQVIVSNTAPPVPYEPIAVHNPDTPGTGFLLLAVPRSPAGPHAVTALVSRPSKDVLRYPRRGGSRTEWLTETDVATAYRARFTAAAEREQRLADIEEDLVDTLAARTTPHLIVTVVPELVGDMVIDSTRFTRYQQELLGTQLYLGQGDSNFGLVTVGPRRLIVTEGRRRYSARAELHRDGSATIALPLNGRIHVDDYEEAQLHTAEPGDVVYPLLCALPYPATGRPRPLTLESYPHATAAAGVLLDGLVDRERGLLQATATLADELLQAYGYPETGLITRAGELNPVGFSERTSGAVAQWAEQRENESESKGVPLLRFSLPRNPDVIAAFLRTRVLRPDSEVWLTGYNELCKWVQTHGHAAGAARCRGAPVRRRDVCTGGLGQRAAAAVPPGNAEGVAGRAAG
ncbi:helix-turn-helix domain-containing protein [Streptomyces sp. NPDC021218]|uniref:helix-turn-helix domain-containing protein n=1 Tax=Streptomyces sp. NPDC021218 TaxID=3365119 RepID=UPI0037BC44F2